MKYLILFIHCLMSFWANAQTVTRIERDKINEGQCCSIEHLKNAWYEKSATDSILSTKNNSNSFFILVDTKLKNINFISDYENHLKEQAIKLDTFPFHLLYGDKWTKLSINEKQEFIEQQKLMSKKQADSIHSANNKNQSQVWIINNTDNNIPIPMQDFSYICVLQALSKSGQWTSIENWQFSWCGNSYHDKVFKPKTANYFITKLPTTGNFETKLRFKLLGKDKFYYSNEFIGKINLFDIVNNKENVVDNLAQKTE